MQKLLIIFLLLSTSTSFAQEPLTLTVDSTPQQFLSLENGVAKFENTTKKFEDLPVADQKRVMTFTGWGRVWSSANGDHHLIADLAEVLDDSVVLEKSDGSNVTIPLNRLSNFDQQYADSRRKLSGALPEHFSAKVIGVADGDTVTVLLNRRQFKIRITGIDAPEKAQAFWSKI